MLNERFFFDLAGWAFPGMQRGLLEGVGVSKSRILYGSDYPFTKLSGVQGFVETMEGGKGMKACGWTEEEIEGAMCGNARRLFGMERAEAAKDEKNAGTKVEALELVREV